MTRVLLLALCGALLAACGGASRPAAHVRAPVPVASSPTAIPVVTTAPAQTCSQQFQAWYAASGRSVLSRVSPALNRVATAADAGDLTATGFALLHVGRLALRMNQHPVPQCADPQQAYLKMMVAMARAAAQAGGVMGNSPVAMHAVAVQARRIGTEGRKLAAEFAAVQA